MKYIKLAAVIFVAFVSIMLLSSCELSTTLTADENFSGTREMVCTIKKSELESEYVYGSVDEIETELRNYLPDALTMERKATITGGYRFIFYLRFSSYQDYVTKVTSLLGREPSITYSQKNGLFCSGIALKEDFTSADLLGWAARAMENSKLCPRIDYGEIDYTLSKVVINGEELENKDPSNKKINVSRQKAVTINGIDISTEKLDFEQFKRTVVYRFPEATVDKVGKKKFEEFMKSLEYKDCKAGIEYSAKNADSGELETLVTYSFTVGGDELGSYTNAVLNGKDGEARYDFDPDSLTPFSGEWGLNERFDLSGWCNLYDYALCPVSLRYKTNDGSRFSKSYAVCGVAAINADIKNNGRVSEHKELTSGNIKVDITANYSFSLKNVKISVTENSKDAFTKTVTLLYNVEEDSEFGPEYLIDYYKLKGFKDGEFKKDVTGDGLGRLTVNFYGDTKKISDTTQKLFGEGNMISDRFDEKSKYTLTLENFITDQNDLSRFLQEAGYSGKITYVFLPYINNSVQGAVIVNSEGEVIADVEDKLTSTGKITAELSEYAFSCEYSALAQNNRLIIIFVVSVAVLVAGVIAMIFFDNKSKKAR